MAHRALGLVAKEETDLRSARQHLATAVRVARTGQLPVREAEARMSLALVLANLGQTARALAELQTAEASLDGPARARLRVQRALILQHQDRAEEALTDYRKALPVLRRTGDQLWETRALLNRGVLRTNRGEFGAAEKDLLAALDLCRQMDFDFGAGLVQHGLGYLFARKGDVVAALEWYDRAELLYRAAGVKHPTIQFDRGELLLSARLVAEARRAVRAGRERAEQGTDGAAPGRGPAHAVAGRAARRRSRDGPDGGRAGPASVHPPTATGMGRPGPVRVAAGGVGGGRSLARHSVGRRCAPPRTCATRSGR